jgi:aryl-alcohol dehydrogenase-like predicted oxidoreductase
MDYVNLGKTGLKVSRLCLGCMTYGSSKWRAWVLNEEESRPFFKRAIEEGINFFDTANMYSDGVSEEVTGRALRDFGKRDELVIATKVFNAMRPDPNGRGNSRKAIMTEIDHSLRRLGTDYVDLYQIHRWDYGTPIAETMEALHDVVKAGKARYIGASSTFAWQLAQSLSVSEINGWTKFVSMQNHYNLVYREEEREMIPLCRDQGIGLIPWSPLARGFLAGNRTKSGGETSRANSDQYAKDLYFAQDDDFAVLASLTQLAKARGLPNMQVALAWVLAKPGITAPIIGASKMPHLEDALKALSVKLSAEEMKQLEQPYKPHPILGHS